MPVSGDWLYSNGGGKNTLDKCLKLIAAAIAPLHKCALD